MIDPAYLAMIRMHHSRGVTDRWNSGRPLVTCYIPTYNRPELLFRRSLPSIQAQTYENLDIIVANHGCNAEVTERIEGFMAKDKRIRHLAVPRTKTYPETAENHWLVGPVQPANAALLASRGDWIARLDDDDIWSPHHIENSIRYAQKADLEFVSSMASNPKGQIIHPYDYPNGIRIGSTQTWVYRKYLRLFRYNRHCWRKPWDRVNDIDLQVRFVRAGVRIGIHYKVGAYVGLRPDATDWGSAEYLKNPEKYEDEMRFR